jgi:hypothetical protein
MVDQQENSKREDINILQIHSIGHGVITFCRSQAIKLPTRQKIMFKMDRRIEGNKENNIHITEILSII